MKSHKTLQIAVKAIPDTGKELSLELGAEWFQRWRDEDPALEFNEARISGTVTLARHGHDILVRGHLTGRLGLTCGRCLEAFDAPVESRFDLLLVPGPAPEGSHDDELTKGELDLDYYTGEVVDLETLLREQIILMLPLKPLCAEVCQGLCPGCGVNLNRQTCTCADKKSESSFAGLAKLKV